MGKIAIVHPSRIDRKATGTFRRSNEREARRVQNDTYGKNETPEDRSRRHFLVLLGTTLATLGGVLRGKDGPEQLPKLIPQIADELERLREQAANETAERQALLSRLMRCSGPLHLVSPNLHSVHKTVSPHDLCAMAAAAMVFKQDAVLEPPARKPVFAPDALVSAGSSEASGLARHFVPTNGAPYSETLLVKPKEMPYHFLFGTDSSVKIRSAALNGRERPVSNNGLMYKGEPWHPIETLDGNGWLRNDYLLLTVLQRNRSGGYATIIAGGHGAGTHAFELLANKHAFPLANLRRLVADVDGMPGFQVLFEVPVKHDSAWTMPAGLRMIKEPEALPGAETLLAYSDEETTEFIRAQTLQKDDRSGS